MNMSLPCFFLHLLFVFFISSLVSFSSSQSNSQNFETFYPFPVQFPSPAPSPTNPNSSFLSPGKVPSPQPSAPPPQISTPLLEPKASHTAVAKAVAVTAVSTFVIAALLFFFIQRYAVAQSRTKRIDTISGEGHPPPPVLNDDHFSQVDGSLKDVIVDENGLDVLYWRKLEEESKNGNSQQEEEDDDDDDETVQANSEPIQEIPLLRGKSSVLQNNKAVPEIGSPDRIMAPYINPQSEMTMRAIEKSNLTSQTSNLSHLPPPPSAGPPLPTPPPPPPFSTKENKTPPPPPPPKAVVLATSSKLPPVAKGMASKDKPGKSSAGEGREGNGNGQVKLKPLHWDKVNKNTDHSMVWDKIGGGSFRFDDDLMEALFGYVATNRRSPKKGDTSDLKNQNGSPPAQIAILDVRKSQNIAIVLKSLGISREKILDGLTDGQGLNGETLEKLMRIAPTKDEESQILEFDGDPSRLADAEFFLYHLLKAVPSAFTRLNAMLFRLNYDSEILQFKDSLQTLELGCNELRNRGLFIKLLEAILKAGNRMNAGTLRGNAQAFNLTSLRKLSDVKSSDGKTTLLHFIVEEVVRSEGKRCVINRNRSLNRSLSRSSSNSSINSQSREDREKEYIMLGLPMVGGLSSEFSNAKKAAQIDYESFAGTCSAVTARIAEVRLIALQCAANGEGAFAREMKGFTEAAEEELTVLKDKQMRIMELVKRTTEYYQTGASKNKEAHPLQLFLIINEFLNMVDQVCIEIARNLQKRKRSSSGSPAASPMPVRFPNLSEHFLKEKSTSTSSESYADF
ncbi:hypothetical protein P3X46_015386 [Hevea brasiliensis]|uniref:Formin-like protein n=1 Tax=Hevea brasiliensis TaxID=3981 RepID=A0ABQ9LZ20_HEVBR|nr:formin-like protein 8 [Hevea brasiliensis]KAJ9172105.1 hypothetical protein P3X46_015386 [Hevea brasiliensis]